MTRDHDRAPLLTGPLIIRGCALESRDAPNQANGITGHVFTSAGKLREFLASLATPAPR